MTLSGKPGYEPLCAQTPKIRQHTISIKADKSDKGHKMANSSNSDTSGVQYVTLHMPKIGSKLTYQGKTYEVAKGTVFLNEIGGVERYVTLNELDKDGELAEVVLSGNPAKFGL